LRDFQVYLEDIIDALNCIEAYTKGFTYEAFVNDRKTVDAVIRNFEIIGEAAKQVPLSIRREYSKVPWREMAGMRDKLIHGYFGIQLDVVWKTIKERLPPLRLLLLDALADMKK
jgi:uncharacterized protein with HEPN domain